MELFKEYQEIIMKIIRPKTVPIGVCLLKSREAIPEKALIISEALKVSPSICQLVSIARYEEKIVAAIRPYMSCSPGMFSVGMIKIPNKTGVISDGSFSDANPGEVSKYLYTEDMNKGKMLEEKTGIIQGDQFEAIVVAPLELISITPTLVLQYANPSQILKMSRGYIWKTGEAVEMLCTGRAGLCSGAIAESFNRNKPMISIPSGDNQIGLTEDDELIFAIPFYLMNLLINGLQSQQHISMLKYPPVPYAASYFQLNMGIVPMAGKAYERTLIKAFKKYT